MFAVVIRDKGKVKAVVRYNYTKITIDTQEPYLCDILEGVFSLKDPNVVKFVRASYQLNNYHFLFSWELALQDEFMCGWETGKVSIR